MGPLCIDHVQSTKIEQVAPYVYVGHTIFAWPGLIGRVELIQSVRIQETMSDGLLSVTTIEELKGAECVHFLAETGLIHPFRAPIKYVVLFGNTYP